MKGYKIYITQSKEVAELVWKALKEQVGETYSNVSYGSCRTNEMLPEIYRVDGMWYAMATYKDLEQPKYEIVFA